MIRLTPIASATSSTARRRVNAPRSSSSRMARCFSSRASVGRRAPNSRSTASISRSSAPCSGAMRTAAMIDALPLQRQVARLALVERQRAVAPSASTIGFTASTSG